MQSKQDIGAEISVANASNALHGNVPVTAGAATRNSAAIDRLGFDSCLLVGATGAETGTPTGRTLDASLEQSDDGASGWTAITGSAITQIAAVNTTRTKSIDLRGAKRYIRVVEVVTLTAGSSPTIGKTSFVVLGGADKIPAENPAAV